MSKIFNAPSDWFYSKKWGIYQKVNDRVYVYVTVRAFDGFQVQLYERGETGMCELEFRADNPIEVFNKGEEWLNKFADGNLEEIRKDYWSPHNLNSYWALEYYKTRYQ